MNTFDFDGSRLYILNHFRFSWAGIRRFYGQKCKKKRQKKRWMESRRKYFLRNVLDIKNTIMSIAPNDSHIQLLQRPICRKSAFSCSENQWMCHYFFVPLTGQMRMCERVCASLCVFVGCAEHHKMSIFSSRSLMRLLNSGFRSSQILAFWRNDFDPICKH